MTVAYIIVVCAGPSSGISNLLAYLRMWLLASSHKTRNPSLMSGYSHPNRSQGPRAAFLRVATHVDAWVSNPAEYWQCVKWWVIGKRLRARMHLAPLLGQSRRAYQLWQLEQGKLVPSLEAQIGEPRILALIASGNGADFSVMSCISERIGTEVITEPRDLSELDLTDYDWLLPMRAGDALEKGAGERYRAAARACHAAVHVIYADDDTFDAKDRFHKPHLKPDWNSELFKYHDYITGAALLRPQSLDTLPKDNADWASRLTRQAIAACDKHGGEPQHLRCVLHHRRSRPAPRIPVAPLPPPTDGGMLPTVSVIIPTRNRLDLLRVCLEGLLRTDYHGNLEIIVIDNGSDEPETIEYLAHLDKEFAHILRDDQPFNFAALNNRAVQCAKGQFLCFLNNDIEVHDPHWLTAMVRQALREEVGAVGARLLYPDGLIQHAGVVVGIGGAAAHAHRRLSPKTEGYFARHNLPQFVTAVTAACLVMRRDRFLEIGGFDSERFSVSFNDVDLCLRLGARGWRCLYEPRATLTHHESVSRGLDRDGEGSVRQAREVAALQERWQTGLVNIARAHDEESPDPYHHPGLSPLSEQFVLRL